MIITANSQSSDTVGLRNKTSQFFVFVESKLPQFNLDLDAAAVKSPINVHIQGCTFNFAVFMLLC